MKMNIKGITIARCGLAVEAVGLVLDIAHHLNNGVETPEGLFTFEHTIIFIGFLITAIGILKITSDTQS